MNKAITKFNSQLGRYEPSSSATKELYGNSLNIGVKQQEKHTNWDCTLTTG